MQNRTLRELQAFERPSRYSGGEWNAVVKDYPVGCRLLLAFPDLYEIGMSHLGLRILYGLVNERKELAAERAFAPWFDMETAMRNRREPLRSLETGTPAGRFDMVGFSLQHELTYTNLLNMLDLAGIPVRAADRGESAPLVLAGGPCVFNPEPLAPFIDIFIIGDAEATLPEVMLRYAELRRGGADRQETLHSLSTIRGLYAPALYETESERRTGLLTVRPPVGREMPFIKKALIEDLDRFPFPAELVVPFCEIVHDRAFVEIARGCGRGCRFCQAGVIYMPERRRAPQAVADTVAAMLGATGFGDLSLSALTPNEYPALGDLVRSLMQRLRPEGISLSLASLSPSGLDGRLLESIKSVRKTGVTIAPEAGTQRLRDVINKGIDEEEVLGAARAAFRLGWKLIKLYFMVGLPTERDEDVTAVADLALAVARLERGIKVNAGVSNFVPKPHTPFQWLPMAGKEEFLAKHEELKRRLRKTPVQLKIHDLETSLLEGVISRGDRKVGEAVEAAWRLGCRFDSWSDKLRVDLWKKAFEKVEIDPDRYLNQSLSTDAILPWSHIDPGVREQFLRAELERALRGQPTLRCTPRHCPDCGACPPALLQQRWAKGRGQETEIKLSTKKIPDGEPQRIRLRYSKKETVTLLSHLDLARLVARVFRRAGIRLDLTKGFHPMPRISFGPALPLGMEGRNEYLDAVVIAPPETQELLRRLNAVSPAGLEFTAAVPTAEDAASLSARLVAAQYRIVRPDGGGFDVAAAEAFMAKDSVERKRKRKGKGKEKGKEQRVDLRRSVLDMRTEAGEGALLLLLSLENGPLAKPSEVVAAAFSLDALEIEVLREQLFIRNEGKLSPPI